MADSVGSSMQMRGMKAVAEALRLEDYPMDRETIDYTVGDVEVEDGAGGFVPVRDLTTLMPRQDYRSAEEIMRALHESAERRRRAAA